MRGDLQVGDRVVVVDELAIGDLVYLDGQPDGRVFIRRLAEWQAESFEGRIHRLEPGPEPGIVRIRLVNRKALLP